MKTNILYWIMLLALLGACSGDSDNGEEPDGSSFTFDISGEVSKKISGNYVVFTTNTDKDVLGNDSFHMAIGTIDVNGKDQVDFGIIQNSPIGAGTYPVEFALAPLYDAYVIYGEDPNGGSPIYGPAGGTITLTHVSAGSVAGSLNVSCEIEGGGTVTIKGNFSSVDPY